MARVELMVVEFGSAAGLKVVLRMSGSVPHDDLLIAGGQFNPGIGKETHDHV
jgi:hypothetical protein